jgi:hypothetical protein
LSVRAYQTLAGSVVGTGSFRNGKKCKENQVMDKISERIALFSEGDLAVFEKDINYERWTNV